MAAGHRFRQGLTQIHRVVRRPLMLWNDRKHAARQSRQIDRRAGRHRGDGRCALAAALRSCGARHARYQGPLATAARCSCCELFDGPPHERRRTGTEGELCYPSSRLRSQSSRSATGTPCSLSPPPSAIHKGVHATTVPRASGERGSPGYPRDAPPAGRGRARPCKSCSVKLSYGRPSHEWPGIFHP